MATKKISDLIAVTTVSGAAVLPVVQDGSTVKVTFADLTGSIELVPSASYVLNAVSASYALSASHETTYELSSSYAETASFATFAAGVYKDSGPVVIGNAIGDISVDGLNTTVVNITALGNAIVTGSLDVNGTVEFNGGVTGSFSGSFEGDGSGLTGISTGGSLEGAGFMGSSIVNFYSDPTILKRDNLIVHENNVDIRIPLASNFALGTVVEFDIFIPTGSLWNITTYDQAGNGQSGFMHQGYKGFNQVDFNPSFAPWFGPYKYFGFPSYYNGSAGSFGDLTGDYYHNGPALVRLVAVHNSFDPTDPTTPATTPMGYLWLARIIARQPMSNSVGTGLAVETVAALPASNNSTGDLVMFDAGSGLKLHVYNGTSWDAV